METEAKEGRIRSAKTSHLPLLPELDVYIHLLVLVHLIDSERLDQVGPRRHLSPGLTGTISDGRGHLHWDVW